MARARPPVAAAVGLLALLIGVGALHAQGLDDSIPPTISFSPGSGLFNDSSLDVTIHFCDDSLLNGTTEADSLNGSAVSLTSEGDSCSGSSAQKSVGTLTLSSGNNTLVSHICDVAGNCTSRSTVYVLDDTDPVVTISPHSGSYGSTTRSVHVTWSDDQSLDVSSRFLVLNGDDVTSSFATYDSTGTGVVKVDTGTVPPPPRPTTR